MPDRGPTPSPTISRGSGGPSIGAPAGTGELLLAVPAGVDGLPVVAGADTDAAAGTDWDRVIGDLEGRLALWRAALRGEGAFPGDFHWPDHLDDCPPRLRERARRVLAMQRDIEDELTARRAALGGLLHGIGTTERRLPIPLFVDQRS